MKLCCPDSSRTHWRWRPFLIFASFQVQKSAMSQWWAGRVLPGHPEPRQTSVTVTQLSRAAFLSHVNQVFYFAQLVLPLHPALQHLPVLGLHSSHTSSDRAVSCRVHPSCFRNTVHGLKLTSPLLAGHPLPSLLFINQTPSHFHSYLHCCPVPFSPSISHWPFRLILMQPNIEQP